MVFRPQTNRPSTLTRRDALLRAAVELVAERGVSGVTHRGVAERAGLPLSATSYFFASIEELVSEALRTFLAQSVERIDAIAAEVDREGIAPKRAAELLVATLLETPSQQILAQFEGYLESHRQPEVPEAIKSAIRALERLAETMLSAAGAARPAEAARPFVAMIDGFALNRLAWPRGDSDRTALRDALESLFIAYTMSDDERSAWTRRLESHRADDPSRS